MNIVCTSTFISRKIFCRFSFFSDNLLTLSKFETHSNCLAYNLKVLKSNLRGVLVGNYDCGHLLLVQEHVVVGPVFSAQQLQQQVLTVVCFARICCLC